MRIESIVGRPVRLAISGLPPVGSGEDPVGRCRIHADLLPADADDSGFPDYLQVETEPHFDRPATLRLSREDRLRLRRVPVRSLGFDARGRNGLRGATIDLPDYGLDGERARRAYLGDVLALESVEGDLMEIVVQEELIAMVFNGVAREARLRGETLRPNALRTLAYDETYVLIMSLILGILPLAAALEGLWR